MADDSEKIALIIETQAQLAGLRQASAGLSDVAQQATATNQQVRISAEQSQAAWAKSGGSVHAFNAEIDRLVAAQRAATAAATQTVAATNQTTQATAAASDVVEQRLNPNLRTAALGASRLTLAFEGMGGGIQGVARSVGSLSYGVADLAGPGFAAMASGVAAAAIVLATLGDLLYKDAQRATALSDAFKEHLGNLKLDATTSALNDVHRAIGGLETQIPSLTDKLKALVQYGPSAFANANDSFLTNLRHELTLTTDAEDLFGQKLKENEALGARNAEQTKAMAEAVAELNAAYGNSVLSSGAKARELQDQIAGNTYASQRVALAESERTQIEEINKRYSDYAKNTRALTADQIAQQQVEITNAQTQLSLGLKLVDVQKARADAQAAARIASATAAVQARGFGASSDIEGPQGTLNQRLREIDAEVDKERQAKVNEIDITKTALAERARAYRDYYAALDKEADQAAQREERRQAATLRSIQRDAASRSDLDGPDAVRDAALARNSGQAQRDTVAGVAPEQVAQTRRDEDLRALRDYYAEVEKMRRENQDAIAESRSDLDPEAAEAAARLAIWRDYYDNLNKLGISNADQQTRRDQALARLDRDVFVAAINHLKQSASAAETYGGVVGTLAKATGDAIRRGELAVNAYKDFGKAKAFAADAIGAAAGGNFISAAGYGAASVAMFAAAGFEAAGAIGSSGGGGGASGGGGGGSGSGSTFTPNNQNQSGGQTIVIQTVNPNDRSVIAATNFYLNQQQVLKVPALLPPAANGYSVGRMN